MTSSDRPVHLFIGSTVRSGGSLLARLLDHHRDVGSYPFELHLPMDPALHPSLARRGEKNHVQDFPRLRPGMSAGEQLHAALVREDPRQCHFGSHFAGGRMKAKSRHMDVAARFDHARFLERARDGLGTSGSTRALYDSIHRAFFATWDDGAHGGTLRFVAYHRANGLLADVPRFLDEFPGAFFIQPIRSLAACLASEKKKVLGQLLSGRAGESSRFADRLLRGAYGRYVENTIVDWLVTFTRSVLLKERLGEAMLVYRYEELVRDPAAVMRPLAAAVGLDFDPGLLAPTNAGVPWAGNSMFGATAGVDATRAAPPAALNRTELELVERLGGGIERWLEQRSGLTDRSGPFLDYGDLDRALLFDHEHQRRFFDDRDKTALYFAALYERWQKRPLLTRLAETLGRRAKPYYL